MCCNKFQQQIGGTLAECYSNETSKEENKVKFAFRNKNKSRLTESFCSIKIDACVDKTQHKKCDYLFIRCNLKHFYFVELKKGGNIPEAYKQIESSIKFIQPKIDLKINMLERKIPLSKENIFGVIAVRSVPRPQSLNLRGFKERFRKIGKELIVTERGIEI